ncbi:type I-B CRISPR-associated protein Cas7/Csh2 [Rhodothermus marinus]|uniref:type I-B CRISPR-associated protein Cas7/Csh2 n=1 Tax=Rhodothermus marinus TaxID=29549 RepID=UPI0012BA3FA1|nr:type I-B CRISPR-associated protein Cas7/Csh2 [Rhodothermus marinus]BBM69591.1 type I-B CRISPR-associated protein Cas7/Csh2 [Rhodothermus marinus]BBM72573.1 type I-B CRISPR-associated protein Cas7/Csh2 [Rhodothermus marinus]
MSTLQNRHEILFLYDVSWANPNGDPMDENKPRIDEETGVNIVTDVRLKRTVRDALMELGYEVFLREERGEDGSRRTKEDIMIYYESDPRKVLEQCIDIRLFGGTFALKGDDQNAFSLTGPVQFKFGRSLHRVKVELIKGTSIMPSAADKRQGTFTEVYVVPYSFIVFYGIANEKAAAATQLTEEDLEAMFKALWVGHKAGTDVITRSKFGHEPRLLVDIVYKPGTLTHMGELDKLVAFRSEKNDEAIRDISDGMLDLSGLVEKMAAYKDKIEKVRLRMDGRLRLVPDVNAALEVPVEPFTWSKEI